MSLQKSKQLRVRIVNPVPGGRDSTSLAHARRYCRRNQAKFVSPDTIEFLGPLHAIAANSDPAEQGLRHSAHLELVIPSRPDYEGWKRRDEAGLPNFLGILPINLYGRYERVAGSYRRVGTGRATAA